MADGGNSEADKTAMQLDSSAGLTYQSITDVETQKAATAHKEFDLGNYEECMKIVKFLQASRPQDSKIFHNISVTEFYQSRCSSVMELYSNLLLICKQANVDVQDIDSIDDVDQCVVFFNRAVLLYHLHKYRGAISILDKVFQFVEPLGVNCDIKDGLKYEGLGRKICLLLLDLYLCTHQPKKALSLIGYIEATLLSGSANKSSKSPEKDETKERSNVDELKLTLVQCKARCYTMMKTAKPCKREVKTLMVSGSKAQHIAAFVIKSQLEYQRGNYRKAIKILNSPEWPEDFSQFFSETGDCLQAMYYNNLGCIHYYMGKPGLGAFYIERALKELEEEKKKLRFNGGSQVFSSQPMHTLCVAIKRKLIYNLGMQHFQRQRYQEAFNCFIKVSDIFFDNPRLWLRIAECCIRVNSQEAGADKPYQLIKSVVGSGENRKIILNPVNETSAIRQINESSGSQTATLHYAVCALGNALMLLPKDVPLNEVVSGSRETVEEKDVNPLEETCLQVLPCNAISLGDVQSLRNAILIALSYVSLRTGDLLLAHDYAQQLLSQPRVSEAHRFLAHMYAGEALVYLDKISQAVEHFKPELFTDISQALPPSADEVCLKHQVKADTPDRADAWDKSRLKPAWFPDSLPMARLIAQYNLSVVYAMRGEWSKSLRLVSEVVKDEKAPPQALSLLVYIHLSQGATDVALLYLNKGVLSQQR